MPCDTKDPHHHEGQSRALELAPAGPLACSEARAEGPESFERCLFGATKEPFFCDGP